MRIRTKLLFSFLLTGLALVVGLYVLLQWSVDRGVLSYINQRHAEHFAPLVLALEQHYSEQGSWQAFRHNPRLIYRMTHELGISELNRRRRPPPPPRPPPDGERGGGPDEIGLLDEQRNTIIASNRRNALLLPLRSNGEAIGWLVLKGSNRAISDFELSFLDQQQETLLAISAGLVLLALMVAYPLARHFTRPLYALENSMARLSGGHFSERIQLERNDEFGKLARSFNELARTLQDNDSSRKRWLADTSHELRTPLAIVRAQLGAMLDDVRPLSKPELKIALKEVEHLQKLMDDLQELSNADIGGLRYHKHSVDLSALLQEVIDAQRVQFQERNIALLVEPVPAVVPVFADPNRLHQMLGNIINNSLKYTTEGGEARLSWSVDKADKCAHVVLEDSPPGVAPGEHEELFEHLYRTEASRNRATGGSGLGLAICKRIVEAHDGSISAAESVLGGLRIDIRLPLEA